MRHRRKGRRLGRSSSHRKAMLKNLASSLILTERDAELDDNAPKVQGRVITTLQKAKEVRPLLERVITIARRALSSIEAAREFETSAERGTDTWRQWRHSDQWQKWNAALAPAVAARRRVLQMLGDKQAMQILFDEIAPRFADRPGGYTRILKLATPRLGDAGDRAILEFVGKHDRVAQISERPAFDDHLDMEDDFEDESLASSASDEVAEDQEASAAEMDQESEEDSSEKAVADEATETEEKAQADSEDTERDKDKSGN